MKVIQLRDPFHRFEALNSCLRQPARTRHVVPRDPPTPEQKTPIHSPSDNMICPIMLYGSMHYNAPHRTALHHTYRAVGRLVVTLFEA